MMLPCCDNALIRTKPLLDSAEVLVPAQIAPSHLGFREMKESGKSILPVLRMLCMSMGNVGAEDTTEVCLNFVHEPPSTISMQAMLSSEVSKLYATYLKDRDAIPVNNLRH